LAESPGPGRDQPDFGGLEDQDFHICCILGVMRMTTITQFAITLSFLITASCGHQPPAPSEPVSCNNSELTDYDGLLILAPHPDDEVLGFSGLAGQFILQGKPVRTVVVTDGDAYCEACTLWTTGSTDGATCDAPTLSNLKTPEADSLAETRRLESTAAAAALGRPAPEFLTYPDTGLGAAWLNKEAGDTGKLLRRSDFSQCVSCGECGSGYGAGPETALSADTLVESLDELIPGPGRRRVSVL
jgi:hypothetical protein